MIDIIWIKRVSNEEDQWLYENLCLLDRKYNVIVVGHTNLNPKYYNFLYIPFYEHGLDQLGLICHKKNLGIKNSKSDFCLVLHADVTPDVSFYDKAINKNYDFNTVIAPLAVHNNSRALSWCNYPGKHKDVNELADNNTYISGGSIFGRREIFIKFPWNEQLRHNMEEDVELSRRMISYNVKLICDSELIVHSRRSQ